MRRPSARSLLACSAVAGLLLTGLPAGAADAPRTSVGSPSVPGTSEHVQPLGSTDLGGRGLNSPLAVAGDCAYVGDRDSSGAPREGSGVADPRLSRPASVQARLDALAAPRVVRDAVPVTAAAPRRLWKSSC